MLGFPRISIDLLFSAALAATIGFGAQAFIPAPALAEDCPGHPDALGTSRVLVVDPANFFAEIFKHLKLHMLVIVGMIGLVRICKTEVEICS